MQITPVWSGYWLREFDDFLSIYSPKIMISFAFVNAQQIFNQNNLNAVLLRLLSSYL